MSDATERSKALHDLRRRAEALVDSDASEVQDMSPARVQKLVHELQTYQLELELQNEELRLAQEALLDAHRRVSELYDFAPVGYLTTTDEGLIID